MMMEEETIWRKTQFFWISMIITFYQDLFLKAYEQDSVWLDKGGKGTGDNDCLHQFPEKKLRTEINISSFCNNL